MDAIGTYGRIDAVGHRIVHGRTAFTESVRIDREVMETLRALSDLAPLHQPRSLAVLDTVTSLLPDARAIACFDTAFHADVPGGRDLRPSPRVAPAAGAPTVRLPWVIPLLFAQASRTPARPAPAGAAPGDLPPRRRCVPRCCPGSLWVLTGSNAIFLERESTPNRFRGQTPDRQW